MVDFGDERSLAYCLLINAAVFGSAWFFARRQMTASGSQALLDGALIGYAIQYVSIGLPGLLHCLYFGSVTGVAMICAIGLIVASWQVEPAAAPEVPARDRFIVGGAFVFAFSFILAFAYKQSDLPPISNDAMTYHFPAAVQWMQQGRISLFQTWFFNPSNTYSPLAGSMFILWLILPFGSDVLARFVEVPALFCVGLALYRLCREIGARAPVAALMAAAAILCRPIFFPCMMGKDDLFVVFFIITSLIALSPSRSSEKFETSRFGIAVGLLLAMKYTAFLSLPILLFAVDGPRWSAKKWCVAAGWAMVVAGPWYLRNWIATGNPMFPMGSLFSSARSDAFYSLAGAAKTVLGGEYGLPISIAIVTGFALIVAGTAGWKRPLVRACSVGAAVILAIFFWRSPFPEVRFVVPAFCLLFACAAFSIERFCRDERLAILLGLSILGLSVGTLFEGLFVQATLPFAEVSFLIVAVCGGPAWWARNRARKTAIVSLAVVSFFVFAYINWSAFCRYQRWTRFVEGAGYSIEYPQLTRLWNFVDQHIPADATVAYSNLYFVYPLQGGSLQKRVIYAPTRRGLGSVADLGWLGKSLSGEQLVPAAIRATVASPDRGVWLSNLKKSGAGYLVVGRSGVVDVPAEVGFAGGDPDEFTMLFTGVSGWVYQFHPIISG